VGNGGHLHLSVRRHGVPLLEGGNGPGGLTDAGASLLGSLLEHLPALLPLACNHPISFQRLAPGSWAAPFQAWGIENREAALRLVPAAGDGAPAHLELKVADLTANPYLLLGAVLATAAEGLATAYPLSEPVAGDPARLGSEAPPRLPGCLAEASQAFASSSLLRAALGEALHASVLDSQQAECRRAEGLDAEALLAASRWWPIVGGL
jgi:glutamine synthetase